MLKGTEKIKTEGGHYKMECSKKQILISITGNEKPAKEWIEEGDFSRYGCPCIVIDRDGQAFQLYDEREVEDDPKGVLKDLAKGMIHIALANIGPVAEYNGAMTAAITPLRVDPSRGTCKVPYEFCSYSPYNGFRYYEMLSDAQLQGLRSVLARLAKRYDISTVYDHRCGDLSSRACAGVSGIYLHSALSNEHKVPHPQPELIKILKKI